MANLEATLRTGVVQPIFNSVRRTANPSLPDAVLENWRSNAERRVLDALTTRGSGKVPPDLRIRLESMVEAWNTQWFSPSYQPIEEFEIRCARERDVVLAEESGDPRRVLRVQESEYRRRIAERYGSIELRGIQLSHRVILDLEKVYVPLHLEVVPQIGDKLVEYFGGKADRRLPIVDALKTPHILLIGAPGGGKSTLVSYLASRCALGQHGFPWPAGALPLVVVVRELKDARLTSEWLARQLEVPTGVLDAALSERRVVLLVDGLDEAPTGLRQELLDSLARFSRENPDVPIIVTSRPTGAPDEYGERLPSFDEFRLADFTQEEIHDFIDKWCLAAERSARADADLAAKEASAAAADLKGRIARSRPVQRIAVNPLLATIICVVHRYLGRTIPEHRVTLYEKCTDALLYEWDRAKFPEGSAVGNLDANQKRTLLRGVASAIHEKHAAEIPEAEVVRRFAEKLPGLGIDEAAALKIVREIRDRSGLLVEKRPGMFGFAHLTFQEYLTALDYASRPLDDLLTHVYESWWHEVTTLVAGVPGSDTVGLVEGLLRRGLPESVILAAACVETAVNVPIALRQRVDQKLGSLIPPDGLADVRRLQEVGEITAPLMARVLISVNPSVRATTWALWFFADVVYEPVVSAIRKMISSRDPAPVISMGSRTQYTIGDLAVRSLSRMARSSETARRALSSALPEIVPSKNVEAINPWAALGLPKPPLLGKPSSTPAKSTASKPPSKRAQAR